MSLHALTSHCCLQSGPALVRFPCLNQGLNSFVDFVSLFLLLHSCGFFFFLFFLLFLSHLFCFCPLLVFISPSPGPSPPPHSSSPSLFLFLSLSVSSSLFGPFEVEPSGGTPRRRPLSFCPCCVQEGNVTSPPTHPHCL